jgi:hypothetical protein
MKSGNFNFLEPSGSLQACNGTALAFTLYTLLAGIVPESIALFKEFQNFPS